MGTLFSQKMFLRVLLCETSQQRLPTSCEKPHQGVRCLFLSLCRSLRLDSVASVKTFSHTQSPPHPLTILSTSCLCSVEQEIKSVGFKKIVLPHNVGDDKFRVLEEVSI